MKNTIGFIAVLCLFGCAHTTQTDTLPPSEQAFAMPEAPAVTVTAQDIATSLNSSACVRCQFSEEEQAINTRIEGEMEKQRAAFEELIKQGMSEEEAIERVYVKKQYQVEPAKTKKPARYIK